MFMYKIRMRLRLLIARHRAALGFCPLCNSDAPEVYDCGICEGYQSASGDKFPPTKATKNKWIAEYKNILDAHRDISRLLSKLD